MAKDEPTDGELQTEGKERLSLDADIQDTKEWEQKDSSVHMTQIMSMADVDVSDLDIFYSFPSSAAENRKMIII